MSDPTVDISCPEHQLNMRYPLRAYPVPRVGEFITTVTTDDDTNKTSHRRYKVVEVNTFIDTEFDSPMEYRVTLEFCPDLKGLKPHNERVT
jgi:hypothetical protein